MKYAQYLPHVIDQAETEPGKLTGRPDFLKTFDFKYSAYSAPGFEKEIEDYRKIAEPLIPFCALNLQWEKMLYGSRRELQEYCTAFATSITDKGICYSWNDADYSNLFANSDYTEILDGVFSYKSGRRPLVYPESSGPSFGFRLIIDTHISSSRFKDSDSNQNSLVDVVIHESEDLPYIR